jgi:NHL repeat
VTGHEEVSGDMRRNSIARSLMPAGSALVAVVMAGMLAGGGSAVAVARPGGPAVRGDAAGPGTISTVAGGVGGPARGTKVALSAPCGVAFADGFLYAGASGVVRKVSLRSGWLTTPAGTGVSGPLGDGGAASAASLTSSCGVAVDGSGNLVIADSGNQRIRVVAASVGASMGRR